jgi:hypothetical protein
LIKRLLEGVDSDISGIGQCGKLDDGKSHDFTPSLLVDNGFKRQQMRL